MKYIKITQNKRVIVDDEDFDELNKLKWHARKDLNTFYAQKKIKINGSWKAGKILHMHRFIMNPPDNMFIDHIDGNGLNNQRSNLRIVTHSQNHFNEKIRTDNTSGVKGVYKRKQGKYQYWIAQLGNKYLGQFKTFEDACECRNKAFQSMII